MLMRIRLLPSPLLQNVCASLALAGVSACTRQPTEELVPYVRQPEELVPGKPLFFATAMPFAGSAIGLLVENHEGRPTKIEGNPDHPSSRGATASRGVRPQTKAIPTVHAISAQKATRLASIPECGCA